LVKAEIIKDWVAALIPFSPAEILMACRAWKQENPRNRPRPGDISGLINAERGRWVSANAKKAQDVVPPRVVTTEEMEHRRRVAAEVLRKFHGGRDSD
jgi:hypothetical protein